MSTPVAPVEKTEVDHAENKKGASKLISGLVSSKAGDKQNADLAAEWLDGYRGEWRDISEEESARVRWKIDMHLMPIICAIYFCQQLDKSSLSFASVFNFAADANLVGQDYSWLSSIVYFAQLGFQPLSVYALVRFPVNLWISFCFFGWGASLCIMVAFKSFAGLAVFRFILGAFEASIAPSMLIVVSMWWTRREQPVRNALWYSMNGVATILGSLISYGLGHAQTALKPYQIIFLVCGVISVAFSIPTFFLFPRHPTRASFLSDEQKWVALERIRMNQTGSQSTHFKWDQVLECVTDIKTWVWVIIIFCISMVSGGIGAFGPLILQGFGLSTFQTILYNMIPGAIIIVANFITAFCMQRFKLKSPVAFIASLFPLAGAAALYAMPRGVEYKSQLLAVYFILQIYGCITSVIFSWCFANTAGHTKKTTMTGMLYVGLCTGNIVGPQLYKSTDAPYYHTGLTANMVVLIILSGLVVFQAFWLSVLNARNVKRRKASGKTGTIVDYSLEDPSKWDALRAAQAAKDKEEGHLENANHHQDNAFLDLTDLKNEDFVYSL